MSWRKDGPDFWVYQPDIMPSHDRCFVERVSEYRYVGFDVAPVKYVVKWERIDGSGDHITTTTSLVSAQDAAEKWVKENYEGNQ